MSEEREISEGQRDAEARPFVSKDEFDQLWGDARKKAGLPANPHAPKKDLKELFIHPVLILYTGFFFGPFATAIMAMAVVRGRMEIRKAAFLLGVGGVVWCLIQGLSAYFGDVWPNFWLQFLRSGLNFVMGALSYAVIHRMIRDTHEVRRNTIHRSLGAIIVLASAVWVLTGEMLVLMGR